MGELLMLARANLALNRRPAPQAPPSNTEPNPTGTSKACERHPSMEKGRLATIVTIGGFTTVDATGAMCPAVGECDSKPVSTAYSFLAHGVTTTVDLSGITALADATTAESTATFQASRPQ